MAVAWTPSAQDATAVTADVGDAGDLLRWLPETGGTAWVRRGDGLVGNGEALRLDPGTGRDRFAVAGAALDEWFGGLDARAPDGPLQPGTGPVAFASFTFDPETPGSTVVVPREVTRRRDGRVYRTRIGGPDPQPQASPPTPVRLLEPGAARPARLVYAGSTLAELGWLEAVDASVRAIRRGGLRKVVLARDLHVALPAPLDLRLITRRLADRFPDCWTFVVDGLVGATPELLLRRAGREVTSLVLAGSAPRGADRDEDLRLGAALQASAKDAEEHRISVASVRDTLAPLCRRLEVDPEPHLLRLANVAHLATSVRGELAEPLTALDLAGALHPTAAICGTPTREALARIRALEGMDRGRYSGPVGWIDARGDGEFGIALRCAEVTEDGARLFAGAGIVADSRPEWELEETRLKLRAMQSALEDEGLAPGR